MGRKPWLLPKTIKCDHCGLKNLKGAKVFAKCFNDKNERQFRCRRCEENQIVIGNGVCVGGTFIGEPSAYDFAEVEEDEVIKREVSFSTEEEEDEAAVALFLKAQADAKKQKEASLEHERNLQLRSKIRSALGLLEYDYGDEDEDDDGEEDFLESVKDVASGIPNQASPQANQGASDGKKGGGHTATPHPSKKTGKSPAANSNKAKEQTPKSEGKVSCKTCNRTFNSDNALESHSKAKHGST